MKKPHPENKKLHAEFEAIATDRRIQRGVPTCYEAEGGNHGLIPMARNEAARRSLIAKIRSCGIMIFGEEEVG